MRFLSSVVALLCTTPALVAAHGSHEDHEVDPSGDWATYHMIEEHHISNFDPTSFFTLHDFNNDGQWTGDEVRRMYGLDDESLASTDAKKKDDVVVQVFKLFSYLDSGRITKSDYVDKSKRGIKLPNPGLGPGHHGDDEYEYEIHHFEKFHGEDAKEEDLVHPEDIEHFRKHDLLEDEAERVEREQSRMIVEANIPLKFRKQQT